MTIVGIRRQKDRLGKATFLHVEPDDQPVWSDALLRATKVEWRYRHHFQEFGGPYEKYTPTAAGGRS